MIGSNMGVSKMTIEHLTLILILKLPLIVVFSKIDLCPQPVFNQSFKDLQKVLAKYKIHKNLIEINSEELALNNLEFAKNKYIPYFKISNISGHNIDLFKNYLLNIKLLNDWKLYYDKEHFAIIEDTYCVNGVGLVISITVTSGIINKNDKLMVGPFNGIFIEVLVKSLHNNFRKNVEFLEAGKSGCIAIKSVDKKVVLKRNSFKRGMICIDKNNKNIYLKNLKQKSKYYIILQ